MIAFCKVRRNGLSVNSFEWASSLINEHQSMLQML